MIDGKRYAIECETVNEKSNVQAALAQQCAELISELQQKNSHLKQTVEGRMAIFAGNLFVSKDDAKQVGKYASELCKRIEELEIKMVSMAQLMAR